MNYVTREGRYVRIVDKVDFGKNPQGWFSHHVSWLHGSGQQEWLEASHDSQLLTPSIAVWTHLCASVTGRSLSPFPLPISEKSLSDNAAPNIRPP
jgi:hypothetical protein